MNGITTLIVSHLPALKAGVHAPDGDAVCGAGASSCLQLVGIGIVWTEKSLNQILASFCCRVLKNTRLCWSIYYLTKFLTGQHTIYFSGWINLLFSNEERRIFDSWWHLKTQNTRFKREFATLISFLHWELLSEQIFQHAYHIGTHTVRFTVNYFDL